MYCSRSTSSMLERVIRAMRADWTRPSASAGMMSERRFSQSPPSSGDIAGHRQPAQPDPEAEDHEQAEQEVGDREPDQGERHEGLVEVVLWWRAEMTPAGRPTSYRDQHGPAR